MTIDEAIALHEKYKTAGVVQSVRMDIDELVKTVIGQANGIDVLEDELAAKERQLEAAAAEVANNEITTEPHELAYLSAKPFNEMMQECAEKVLKMKAAAAVAARKRWEEQLNGMV